MRELLTERFNKPTEIDSFGGLTWENIFGELHRENDLPAVIYTSGEKEWWKNGKLHRDGADETS